MAIQFVPVRGSILFCDFDSARIAPEMNKMRRVVVVSPRSYNSRWGAKPGRCLVVPFSAHIERARPSLVHFPQNTYRSLPEESWAVCDAVTLVSHQRLTRVWLAPGMFLDEIVSGAHLRQLESGLCHALGMQIGQGLEK